MNASTINPQYALFRDGARLTDTTLRSLIFTNSFSHLLGLLEFGKGRIKHLSLHHDVFPFGI